MNTLPRPGMMRLILEALDTGGTLGDRETEDIASRLKLPSSRVYGFFTQFEEFPSHPNSAMVRVCTGPACALKGAEEILEALKERVAGDVEVVAEPGLGRWHRSPALSLELPGKETGLWEGLSPGDAGKVVTAIEQSDLGDIKLMGDTLPPSIEILTGYDPSPWWEAAEGGTLPAGWGPDLVRWASRNPLEALKRIKVSGATGGADGRGLVAAIEGAAAGNPWPAVMVCDAVGLEAENSMSYNAPLLHPRAVVAGAALAGAMCGAGEILFYVPWNDGELVKAMNDAFGELLSGSGVRAAVFRGPVQVPSSRDIGRAAVIRGIMLWQAASIYGWGGTRSGGPSTIVLPADLAWKLPWVIEENANRPAQWAGGHLMGIGGSVEYPRLLEIPPRLRPQELIALLGLEPESGGFKAIHATGTDTGPVPLDRVDAGSLKDTAELLLLDSSTCMVRWALYLARRAERGCCGGCAPGRSAPAAVERIIQATLRGHADESELKMLERLLSGAGELALCPRLGEVLKPVLSCFNSFKEEFEAHAVEGICRAGSCSLSVKAAT